jgi:hypothetical protein
MLAAVLSLRGAMMRLISVFACVLLLAGCGASDSGDEEASGDGGVIPQHQLDAMKKAENVEDMLKQSDEQRREKMDSEG